MTTIRLIGCCAGIQAGCADISSDIGLAPIDPTWSEDLARLYLASYPAGVGATNLAAARAEIVAMFAGEFGRLLPEASPIALLEGEPVASIQVVEQSPWDADLRCPFIIDLYVAPAQRGRGLGRALLCAAAEGCLAAGHRRIALRVDPDVAPEALRLYQSVRMVESGT